MYEALNERVKKLSDELSAARRDFHRYAETGWMEMRTSSIIARKLSGLGYKVLAGKAVCAADGRKGLPTEEALEAHYEWAAQNGADMEFLPQTKGGFTGVIGILDCGEGPTAALRFDIDALGVCECGDDEHLPAREGFASMEPGIMHACGHDGHTAIGLGVARILMENRDKLHGKLKLIFQPAEEGVRGAKSIVENGHLDGVKYLLAGHIFPQGEHAGYHVGALSEDGDGGLATVKLDVTFTGRSAHAGISPQLGRNALLAAATATLNLHAIPRFGEVPTQVNVGKISAGSGRNVICEQAELELEVRGMTTEANDYMEEYARRIIKGAAIMHECTYDIRLMGSAPALECSWTLSKRLLDICNQKLDIPATQMHKFCGGSEDYAYMSEYVRQQGGEATYFGLLTDCPAENHNSRFDFDEEALSTGVRVFCGTVLELLG